MNTAADATTTGDAAITTEEVCTIYGAGDEEICLTGAFLRAGRLVAFPTETVYGLGANALDNAAAARIYEVKGRPATDPLIVHVTDIERAIASLWDVSERTASLARVLFAVFAPGPLTLVAKASACVAAVVTGGSGMVGLRVPAHPVARALIDAAGVPIAAPSANTFGHVSPTTAEHVYFDLAARDATLAILDGGRCSVGVESTVARIASDSEIEVLRRGAVSHEMIVAALAQANVTGVSVTVKDTRTKAASGAAPMASPGQLLTHYSPTVPAYLIDVRSSFVTPRDASAPSAATDVLPSLVLRFPGRTGANACAPRDVALRDLVVIDWGDELAQQLLARGVPTSALRAYKSLSARRRSDEASREVFAALRWTEVIEGAEAVALPLVMGMVAVAAIAASAASTRMSATELSLLEAVEDRLFRAASGRVAQFTR